jgi:hypothetical protein
VATKGCVKGWLFAEHFGADENDYRAENAASQQEIKQGVTGCRDHWCKHIGIWVFGV